MGVTCLTNGHLTCASFNDTQHEGKIVLCFHLIENQIIQRCYNIAWGQGGIGTIRFAAQRDVLVGRCGRQIPSQPSRHQCRANAVTGHIYRKQTQTVIATLKEPDQITTNMSARAQHQRHIPKGVGLVFITHKRLL